MTKQEIKEVVDELKLSAVNIQVHNPEVDGLYYKKDLVDKLLLRLLDES